jgi:glutathionylspermidine synthase
MSAWMQRLFTDKLLFDYYLISSLRETDVFSPLPTFLDRKIFETMTAAASTLDGLARRVIRGALEGSLAVPLHLGDFPYKKEILSLTRPCGELFWARFDAFIRADGTPFFTEFNYDKPCAQREILFSEHLDPPLNPSRQFSRKFRDAFRSHLREFRRASRRNLRVAILVDPCHSEETHLAHLYHDLLCDPSAEFIIAGARNFSVAGGRLFAFDLEIDVVLRQFPTEFLYEVGCFGEMLDLFEKGTILIINDPRAILGQAKSIFATLWQMVTRGDPFLRDDERRVIRETLPYTEIFGPESAERMVREKDSWVIKSVLGRYSQEVYIGRNYCAEEWRTILDQVLEGDKLHVAQHFCHARPEGTTAMHGGSLIELEALVNYGIHFSDGDFSGLCARWTEDYLTEEHSVWFSAPGLRSRSLIIDDPPEGRGDLWHEINDAAAFTHGYTGGYTGAMEYFSLQAMRLQADLLREIEEGTERLCQIFQKATLLVQDKPHLLCPVLGIDSSLHELIRSPRTGELTFIGRLDWVLDAEGALKVLEFNSETPAGLMESLVLTPLIAERLKEKRINPGAGLAAMIRETFLKIMSDFSRFREMTTIGFVSLAFYEDWENTAALCHVLEDLPYTFIMGEVSALEARDGRLHLAGRALDAVYRYYPLDWFARDPYFRGVIGAFSSGTLSINPPSTLICQSKAFFALLWELARQGFFEGKELDVIEKYIPHTELEQHRLPGEAFVAKPLLGREGEGIAIHHAPWRFRGQEDYVFQEKVDVQSIALEIHTTTGGGLEARYPVIGAYVTGSSFAGLFVRAGARITDRRTVFLPVFADL